MTLKYQNLLAKIYCNWKSKSRLLQITTIKSTEKKNKSKSEKFCEGKCKVGTFYHHYFFNAIS